MTVILIAVALAAGGYVLGLPRRLVGAMLLLLYAAVLVAHLVLPDGSTLRLALGGSAASWGALGVIVMVAMGYRSVLNHLRRRSEAQRHADPPSKRALSDTELDRYARHIVLREIGGPGQRRLKDAKVLVVGAGGLGSPALLYLAAAGVGTIGVIDDDTVGNSNLQRQIIHADNRIGMPKVFSAEAAMKAINPHINVRPYHRRLTADIARDLFADYDLILDGSDNFATRYLVNEAAVATKKPLIAAAIAQWEGQISLYDPAHGAPCFACIFPEAPADGLAPSCAEAGVIGALPGVVGSMMAVEAIKEIVDAGQGLRGRMLIYDALWGENRSILLAPRAGCEVCGATH